MVLVGTPCYSTGRRGLLGSCSDANGVGFRGLVVVLVGPRRPSWSSLVLVARRQLWWRVPWGVIGVLAKADTCSRADDDGSALGRPLRPYLLEGVISSP